MSAYAVKPSLLNAGPFAAIPYDVLERIRGCPLASNVLAGLLKFAMNKDHCWPSNATLAEWCDASVGHVKRVIRFMEEKGVITRERDYRNTVNSTNRIIRLAWRAGGASNGAPGGASRGAPARQSNGAPVSHKAALREEEKKNAGAAGRSPQAAPSAPSGANPEDPPAPGVMAALWAKVRGAPPRPEPPPKEPAPVTAMASLLAAAVTPKALEASALRRRELAAQLASLAARTPPGPSQAPGTASEATETPFHPKE